MAAAGSPATGVGGMYYMLLFAISIVFRLYKDNTRGMSIKRKSGIVSFTIVTVYFIVTLSTLQALKIISIEATIINLFTSIYIFF
jgi:hypothetical protein